MAILVALLLRPLSTFADVRVETVMVSMRDGVQLATDVYRDDATRVAPVVLMRTPYNKDRAKGAAERFAVAGYVAVVQDCRGKFASEGVFIPYNNEGQDGFDAIEWIGNQPWCNGRIGMWGSSYVGATQWQAAVEHPPKLVTIVAILVLFSIGVVGSGQAADHGFVDLFNGKNLDGWNQRNGTATYRVESDSIVGRTSEGSPNSFLCSDKRYGDFELKFEVKVDPRLNSGVQIRSQSVDDKPEGRVNGPQVEISLDGMAGYIYGEAAGGWMTPDADRKSHRHFKDGEWNAYHVVAFGNTIPTWINGEQVSDLMHQEKFETHPKGFIGLQVHGIGAGQGPYEVRWRNLKLRDLSEFKSLYNGKDLTGWKTTGNWLPQDDGRSLLIQPREGEQGWQRYGAYLWSEKKYKDFVLEVEYAYPPGGTKIRFTTLEHIGHNCWSATYATPELFDWISKQ